jgi:hypothetical protein
MAVSSQEITTSSKSMAAPAKWMTPAIEIHDRASAIDGPASEIGGRAVAIVDHAIENRWPTSAMDDGAIEIGCGAIRDRTPSQRSRCQAIRMTRRLVP